MRKHAISRAIAGARWNPRDGLIGSDQGIWLDPSDLTTMFQDSAGTTPVTAVEQPVGLMLDKSRGLVLGSELVANGGFSNASGAGWVKFSGTNADFSNSSLKISGIGSFTGYYTQITVSSYTWYKLVGTVVQASPAAGINITPEGASSGIASITSTGNGAVYFNSGNNTSLWVYCNVGSGYTAEYDNISVRELPGNHAFQSTSANRPTLSARYNQYVGTEALATQNVTTLATSYTLKFSGPGSITLSGTATGIYTAGTYTVTCTAGTLTSTVSGSVTQVSLVTADQSSLPYQRVNTSTDYDSDATKFPRRINYAAGNSMTVNFPTNLGSSCVVARANPGISAVIAENQTVNTPLTLNTNHSGLVITSRSISVDEKARLDEYLDKKAIAK